MSAPKLRIGYVREHFSSPLLQLAEKDETIELVECPSTLHSCFQSFTSPIPFVSPFPRPAPFASFSRASANKRSSPGGTGQVMSRIKSSEIDVAIALTESLLAGIAKKTAEFKLVGTYVTSPLQWAVIVGKASKYEKLADLKGEKIGISRIGRYALSRSLAGHLQY